MTGITQTSRNFGASLGLAVLGTILISRNDVNVTDALVRAGVPREQAHDVATNLGSGGGGAPERASKKLIDAVQSGFAESVQTVFYVMAAVLAVTFLIALVALPGGRIEAPCRATSRSRTPRPCPPRGRARRRAPRPAAGWPAAPAGTPSAGRRRRTGCRRR